MDYISLGSLMNLIRDVMIWIGIIIGGVCLFCGYATIILLVYAMCLCIYIINKIRFEK